MFPMFLRAFANWARNVVLIGIFAGSPYTRFFGCEWCYHGNGKREKNRGKPRTGGVRQYLIKNAVVRVFPSVEKVREQHQIWRYLVSPAINDYDGYKYSISAFCSECKGGRVARWVPAEARLLKVPWRYRDGSVALSKVSEGTWAEVVEWADRRGESWWQVWAKREVWRVLRALLFQSRLAEMEMEEKRRDAEITKMAIDESANLECDEDGVLGDGY